jgi:hypothetical protein
MCCGVAGRTAALVLWQATGQLGWSGTERLAACVSVCRAPFLAKYVIVMVVDWLGN